MTGLNGIPAVPASRMLDNMRGAMGRGLPEVRRCRPHGRILSVAAGGPSLADTWRDLDGVVAAVNGSLGWLLEREVVPHLCGVLDPGPHMADIVAADRRVRYYVASCCDPAVLDKLAGCHVTIFHLTSVTGADALLEMERPDTRLQIGGGSTMGLRWVTLGYVLGFRRFRLHGLDSSFRGAATHAYPDRRDGEGGFTVDGRLTRPNFLEQVRDFDAMLDSLPFLCEPIEIDVRGDGLLQDRWQERAACGS